MAVVNDTSDDQPILQATADRQFSASWEQTISKIAGSGILNFLHLIHNYDRAATTTQFHEADWFWGDQDEDIDEFEFIEGEATNSILDGGWRCQC